jgi:HK97 family phage major capsid protein
VALTKTEAAKLTNDLLVRGVIDTIVKESSVLAVLPFQTVTGTAMTYNREATNPSAAFYDVGDAWTEATPTFTQVQAILKIMGGDADVDNFLQQSYADPNDLEAEVIAKRAKSVAHLYSDTFFNGDTGVNAKAFDGLKKLLTATSQEMSAGANGAALTLDLMDQAIDLVMPGKPDAIFCSKRTRRKLSSLRRASGSLLETDVDAFGRRALFYDGIPLLVDDFISDTETQGASGAVCSSIFCVKFGDGGAMGLENGGIQMVEVGDLETKDATRWRIKWYAGLAAYSLLGLSRLKGILP